MMSTAPPTYDADPAKSLFFRPGLDHGLHLLQEPQPHWTMANASRFDTVPITENRRIQRRWARWWQAMAEEELFQQPVEYNAVPVLVEDFLISDHHQAIAGKWLLNGAAGDRVLGACFRKGRAIHGKEVWNERLTAHFSSCQDSRSTHSVWPQGIEGLDFVVEARNLANYFHFKRELFCALCLIDEFEGFSGRIKIVANEEPAPGFVREYQEWLFPELTGRIDYVPDPAFFEKALTVWYGDFAHLQSPDPDFEELLPPAHRMNSGNAGSWLGKVLRKNGYSRALRLLRERALARVASERFDLPRRFWVGRRAGKSHDRSIRNEAKLTAELAKRGFETVYFEDMSPAEQVSIMSNAEIMISYHGAGFTNMLYAATDAHVIELGTLQSGMLRWGDFSAFARVSGCHYTLALADYEHDGPEVIPPMRGRGIYPVRLSEQGIGTFLEHVDELVASLP